MHCVARLLSWGALGSAVPAGASSHILRTNCARFGSLLSLVEAQRCKLRLGMDQTRAMEQGFFYLEVNFDHP